ncbi:MAG TPA: hypothetical protein VFW14_08505 [Gaiellales bacterium]|jgi:hypothetical protein|nr:hypothetical protein [Gaiellales bacterium]
MTDPRPPAVIDFTPGWRPAGYQTAVVVAALLPAVERATRRLAGKAV